MVLFGCNIINRGPADSGKIAVTFDDGPHPKHTSQILSLLEKKGCKGTFFLSGSNIFQNRDLTREISERGHQIGNHFFSHRNALFLGPKQIKYEITRTNGLIKDITGKSCDYLRPPFGVLSPQLLSFCKRSNISIVLWSMNTYDYKGWTYNRIIERVVKRGITPGSLLLFHECHYKNESIDYSHTVKSLETVLDIIHSRNMRAVTIKNLFEDKK